MGTPVGVRKLSSPVKECRGGELCLAEFEVAQHTEASRSPQIRDTQCLIGQAGLQLLSSYYLALVRLIGP